MKLEQAIQNTEFLIRDLKADNYNSRFIESIELVLQILKNSIPKEKIEGKMKQIDYRTANGEERYYQKAILQELLEGK